MRQKRYVPEECPVNEKLSAFYGMDCRSDDPQLYAYGPGKSVNIDAFLPVKDESGIFDAYFDLPSLQNGKRLNSAGGAKYYGNI